MRDVLTQGQRVGGRQRQSPKDHHHHTPLQYRHGSSQQDLRKDGRPNGNGGINDGKDSRTGQASTGIIHRGGENVPSGNATGFENGFAMD